MGTRLHDLLRRSSARQSAQRDKRKRRFSLALRRRGASHHTASGGSSGRDPKKQSVTAPRPTARCSESVEICARWCSQVELGLLEPTRSQALQPHGPTRPDGRGASRSPSSHAGGAPLAPRCYQHRWTGAPRFPSPDTSL